MIIIPAIDLKHGRCVRLFQGEMDQETVYFEDPLIAARHWMDEGATIIHIVDLDGAVDPIAEYGHDEGCSLTGGYVYRGESEGLQGQYFFADFVTSRIFTLAFDGAANGVEPIVVDRFHRPG